MSEVDSQVALNPEFETLYQALAPVIVVIDSEGIITAVRGEVARILGTEDNNLVGTSLIGLFYDQDMPVWELAHHRLKKVSHVGPFPIRLNPELCKKSAFEAHLARSKVKGNIVLSLSAYQGAVSLGGNKRPSSSLARQFEKEDFVALAQHLKVYVKEPGGSVASALMKLCGIGEQSAEMDAETSLWALYRFLHDTASEQVAAASAEKKRQAHQNTPKKLHSQVTTASETKKQVSPKMRSAYRKSGNETNYVTVAGDDGISESDAVKAAVYAMKEAANSGKAKTMQALTGGYESRLESVRNQLKLFKKIVLQERFEVALQPIVTVTGGELHHYEALARFDTNLYKGTPFELMTFAEKVGVIQEFDLAMTMKVVSLIKRVRRIGYNVSIAVNISGHSIQSQGFLRHFFRILEDCGDIRNNLMFELTESSQIDDLEGTNRVLSRIRDFGHKVALDDFGAGAAGLQYLRVLKVDCVKIDGVYIRKGIENEENRSFLRSMAELCKGLNIETVGECVETEDQRSFLEEIGVTYAQGWLYGKPKPVDETIKSLSDK